MTDNQKHQQSPLLRKRYRTERRFRMYGIAALAFAAIFLLSFFANIINTGLPAFKQAEVLVEVTYSEQSQKMPLAAIDREYRSVVSRTYLRLIPGMIEDNPELLGVTKTQWILADSDVDQYMKSHPNRLSGRNQRTVDQMVADGRARLAFNTGFFSKGDSKHPEHAGILAAAIGSLYVLLITMAISVPIGVMTAIYLEEFAPDNKFTQIIEVNINNLAAIPSIIFGLLGLAIFINFFHVPRSSALAGGMTLSLMTLPVVIIATRAALRAVPDSIRHGAYAVGASPWQVVWHHVLPVSLPGILTGSIIGLAQAMGETAPLIIVGMIAYIPEAPDSITQATTVLPAQIYTWSGESIRAFVERTAAGIMVLMSVLMTLNVTAIWLRNKFERRW